MAVSKKKKNIKSSKSKKTKQVNILKNKKLIGRFANSDKNLEYLVDIENFTDPKFRSSVLKLTPNQQVYRDIIENTIPKNLNEIKPLKKQVKNKKIEAKVVRDHNYLYELAKEQKKKHTILRNEADNKLENEIPKTFIKESDENWYSNWTPFSDVAKEIHFNLETHTSNTPLSKDIIQSWLKYSNFTDQELKILSKLSTAKENYFLFASRSNNLLNNIVRAIGKLDLQETDYTSAAHLFKKCPVPYLESVIQNQTVQNLYDKLLAGVDLSAENVQVIGNDYNKFDKMIDALITQKEQAQDPDNKKHIEKLIQKHETLRDKWVTETNVKSAEPQMIKEDLNKYDVPQKPDTSLAAEYEADVVAKTAAYLKAKRELLLAKQQLNNHYKILKRADE